MFSSGEVSARVLKRKPKGMRVRSSVLMLNIGVGLAEKLIGTQFPEWAGLSIVPVAASGWDNQSFRLGDDFLIRLPRSEAYAGQVDKEHRWLPVLAPHLPVAIPVPVAQGHPSVDYPFKWSVYRWLTGEDAGHATITDRDAFVRRLARFLRALQEVDATGAPRPGRENFHRGGSLGVYEPEFYAAVARLGSSWDRSALIALWERGVAARWTGSPVWVHGDISPGNLLVCDGALCAVIDFGQLAAGDPACDFAISWTFFSTEEREVFRQVVQADEGTWARARCWAMWKASLLAAGLASSNAVELASVWATLRGLLEEP